jgi:DNA-binding CsgD family transcriptional regulator
VTLLAPHLHRAAEINMRLSETRLTVTGSAEALNRLAQPTMILGTDCTVLFMNTAAEEIVAGGDGLSVQHGILTAADRAQNTQFRRIVAGAAQDGTAGVPTGTLRLHRPSLRRPFSILAAPLRRRPDWLAVSPSAAIVFVIDPERSLTIAPAYLRQAHGLTPAEAAVTLKVLRGRGLQAAANELGISLSTTRTHLQHVFEKTHTRRQAELVRLIVEGQSGLRFDDLTI